MRRLSLCLDALPALREVSGGAHLDLLAASSLAELAGVESQRLGLNEDLRPVAEADVHALRRSALSFELRMAPTQSLLKVALETRPDDVILADESWQGTLAARPLELRTVPSGLPPVIRSLEEAGIGVSILIAPSLEAVKAAHGLGVTSIELYTGATVDLPQSERRPGLADLGDAARLAAKLRMTVGIGGGLDSRSIRELLPSVPTVERISVGRALLARSMLLGLDRAARDFLELVR